MSKSQRRRRRRRAAQARARDPAPLEARGRASGEEFDDTWADGVSVAPGRRTALPPRPRSRSGSRLPRRDEDAPASASTVAAADPAGLAVGRVATVRGVVSRPELVGEQVLLLSFDAAAGRWLARTLAGERLRLLPGRLVPLPEAAQRFSKLRFESRSLPVSTRVANLL